MKKFMALLAICLLTISCSSKVITYDPLGAKTITTRTNEDLYHEAQSRAWSGYYEALKNPPVIAQIQNIDGTVITISSQIPPPAPVIRQHENQYIKPIAEMVKWGIGGIVIDITLFLPILTEGCPAWIEMPVATKGNPLQKETKRQCLDLWNFDLKWAGLGTLEGVQAATESNRNMTALSAMVFTGAENPGQLISVASKTLLAQKPGQNQGFEETINQLNEG